jgi:plasmid maintenance system antidote protein VapI
MQALKTVGLTVDQYDERVKVLAENLEAILHHNLQLAAQLAIRLARANRRIASLHILLKDHSFDLAWEAKIY